MIRHVGLIAGATLLALVFPVNAAEARPSISAMKQDKPELVKLFLEWRSFVKPTINAGVPDYSKAAMARVATSLPQWQARLAAIDRSGWTAQELDVRPRLSTLLVKQHLDTFQERFAGFPVKVRPLSRQVISTRAGLKSIGSIL